MPLLQITHRTVYRYRKPVSFGEHRLMMRPRESFDQHVVFARLSASPNARIRRLHDVFGNCVAIANFEQQAAELVFDSQVLLEHQPHPVASDCEEAIHPSDLRLPFAYDATDMPDLLRSMERASPDPGRSVELWTRRFLKWNGPTPVLSLLRAATQAIHTEFTYRKRLTGPPQAPAETLALGSGTCRDFAVLMMDVARSIGLAAHFVSGYIYAPPGANDPGAQRVGGGHTHAWLEVYLPSCGWVEFDPTNGLIGNQDLIRVAVARDPRQATPLWGSWSGDADDYLGMEVEVDLRLEPERGLNVA
jgi:transglutaminase-like putative cysteine protease